ncbi:MAG: diacylglycerol kinase family lipid kinase [Bacteroidales bacterium]|nr:diacylglycerol kinase family lipid kinase [Bacteroidales bacterium]
MNHLFVLNPKAGKKDSTDDLRRRIERHMSKRDDNYTLAITEYPEHAIEIVKKAIAGGGQWRIYACGGDGTLNEVVNGAAGAENVEITQYPCGTGNDFVKLFGQRLTRFYSIEELIEGESMEFDLIECMDKYSINICSAGFDARIAGDVHKYSKMPRIKPYTAFTISVAYNMFRGINRNYGVKIDGEDLSGKYSLLVAANSRFYGGGYNPVPEADPTDGVLDFLLIRSVSRLQVAKLIKKYSEGKARELGDLAIYRRGKLMEIDCGAVDGYVNIDGEVYRGKSLSFGLSEKRIKFFGPQGCFDELKRR